MFLLAIAFSLVASPWACESAFAGYIVAWGGIAPPPTGNDVVAIAAGHSFGYKRGHSVFLLLRVRWLPGTRAADCGRRANNNVF